MSGIAGILRRDGRPIPEKWVQWLEVSIAQRGADGAGKFQDSIEIASGRLEIVLLHQQMGASDISQPVVHTKDDLPVAVLNHRLHFQKMFPMPLHGGTRVICNCI